MKKHANEVTLIGDALSEPRKLFKRGDQVVYQFQLGMQCAGRGDIIPIQATEDMLEDLEIKIGNSYEVKGEYRSSKKVSENGKKRLLLAVWAKELHEIPEKRKHGNFIKLIGNATKDAIFRTVPHNVPMEDANKLIAEVILAVNREGSIGDYIPVIAWDKDALTARNKIKKGTLVEVNGMLHSRPYRKKRRDGEMEERIAYEVSANDIKVL